MVNKTSNGRNVLDAENVAAVAEDRLRILQQVFRDSRIPRRTGEDPIEASRCAKQALRAVVALR